MLFVWNVSGADPVLTDSVIVSAGTVNDVKVRADGAVAVLSQESGGAADEPGGGLRLEDLGGSTHNAWYWPETGYVFLGEGDFQKPG